MKLDVVIVAYRSEAVIERCLGAVLAMPDTDRVVVVDNGDGESARLAAALGVEAIHDPTNPGFGAGQNRGVSCTSAPLVLLCNPDAEILAEAVAEGARFLAGRPDVAAVQGVIVNSGTGRPERSAGVELGPLHLLGRALGVRRLLGTRWGTRLASRFRTLRDHVARVPDASTEVESLAATVLLVRRKAFEAVGGFDESYFLYGEDLDLCRRLRLGGWKLMALPAVWATHVNGASAESSFLREAQWWRGTMQFASRWWTWPRLMLGLCAATLRCARLAATHPAGAASAVGSMTWEPVRARLLPARAPRVGLAQALRAGVSVPEVPRHVDYPVDLAVRQVGAHGQAEHLPVDRLADP